MPVHPVNNFRAMSNVSKHGWLKDRPIAVPTSPEGRAQFWSDLRVEMVYVIQAEPGTPYKIGKAKNALGRMASLQTGNPADLHLLEVIPGGMEAECSIHRALQGDRIRGEWFEGEATDYLVHSLREHAAAAIAHYFTEQEVLPPPLTFRPKLIKHRVKVSYMEPGSFKPRAA